MAKEIPSAATLPALIARLEAAVARDPGARVPRLELALAYWAAGDQVAFLHHHRLASLATGPASSRQGERLWQRCQQVLARLSQAAAVFSVSTLAACAIGGCAPAAAEPPPSLLVPEGQVGSAEPISAGTIHAKYAVRDPVYFDEDKIGAGEATPAVPGTGIIEGVVGPYPPVHAKYAAPPPVDGLGVIAVPAPVIEVVDPVAPVDEAPEEEAPGDPAVVDPQVLPAVQPPPTSYRKYGVPKPRYMVPRPIPSRLGVEGE